MRVSPTALVLSLAGVLTLAGCFGGGNGHDDDDDGAAPPTQLELTNATFGVGAFLAEAVPALDGVLLHIDVQLPDGPGPFPTILLDTPYSILGDDLEAAQRERPEIFGAGLASFYVARGYATATAHVRGTGESGGCLTIGDPIEGQDGYALVEWIAAQGWSNGKVAMMGTSYDGTTPLETAVWNPPHLTTIVPISPVTEWYLYYFENGLHRNNADPPPGSSNTDPALWAVIGITPGVRTGATGGADDVLCQAEFTRQDMAQDDYNAYWHARDHHANAGNSTVPMLFAHGWQDGNVAPTGVPTLWANVTAEKRMWVQQHGHGVPASKTAYHEYVHRWLDYWLLGRDNGALLLPPVIIEDNTGKFRAEDTWPPADAAAWRLDLTADGRLADEETAAGTVVYFDTSTSSTNAPVAPVEDLERALFATAPFDEPLHIAGAPRLHLRAQLDLPGGQFDANLLDVSPDGTEVYVSRGFLDARHRDSLDQGSDVPPGPNEYEFWLHPNDHIVAAGHRLLLTLKSSDDYVLRSPYRSSTVLRVGEGVSWLDLPVVDDAERLFLDAAPAPWPVDAP